MRPPSPCYGAAAGGKIEVPACLITKQWSGKLGGESGTSSAECMKGLSCGDGGSNPENSARCHSWLISSVLRNQ